MTVCSIQEHFLASVKEALHVPTFSFVDVQRGQYLGLSLDRVEMTNSEHTYRFDVKARSRSFDFRGTRLCSPCSYHDLLIEWKLIGFYPEFSGLVQRSTIDRA